MNPTGALYSSSEISALLAVCQRRGAKVILDVCFSDLQFDGNDGKNQINLKPYLTGKVDSKGVTDATAPTVKAAGLPSPGVATTTAAASVVEDAPASSPSSYALALLGQLSPQVSPVDLLLPGNLLLSCQLSFGHFGYLPLHLDTGI